jgi:hypothetical protein
MQRGIMRASETSPVRVHLHLKAESLRGGYNSALEEVNKTVGDSGGQFQISEFGQC